MKKDVIQTRNRKSASKSKKGERTITLGSPRESKYTPTPVVDAAAMGMAPMASHMNGQPAYMGTFPPVVAMMSSTSFPSSRTISAPHQLGASHSAGGSFFPNHPALQVPMLSPA